jgi:hypothetical protein
MFKGRDLPALPHRQSKTFVDHNSKTFLEDRRAKLTAYLQDILIDPMLAELPFVSNFIGFPHANNVSPSALLKFWMLFIG